MADEFILTQRPVRVTNNSSQPLDQALNIADYDAIDAVVNIAGVEGTTTGVSIRLLTGMQKDTPDTWSVVATFLASALTGPNTFNVQHADQKLLKYLRWEVFGLGGATAVTFDISGMLRRHN